MFDYKTRKIVKKYFQYLVYNIFVPKLFESIYVHVSNENLFYSYINLGNHTYMYELLTEMYSIVINFNDFDTIECIIMYTKDFKRCILCPIIITVKINGELIRAMIDLGLLVDFMSTKFVD